MEDGKKAEAGQSSGCCSVSDQEKLLKEEVSDEALKPKDAIVDDEEEAVVGEGNDEDEDQDGEIETDFDNFVPGPLLPLKDQIDKDKDDESLRRWKEKLLGCVESDLDDQREPEVVFHSIGIVSDGIGEMNTALPLDDGHSGRVLFTLKEGSAYRLKLSFTALHNIVSGLAYTNRIWKGGIQVDKSKGMLGTFAPRREPYVHTLEEQTTPSGVLARGLYTAKLKFEDDDRRCHMKLMFLFEIKKSS